MDAIDNLFQESGVSGYEIGAPGVSRQQGTLRRLVAGGVSGTVGIGATADIAVNVSQAFKAERMFVNAAAATAEFLINNIRIATFSLNVSANPLPVDMFLRDAVGSDLSGYTAQAGVGLVVNATNPSAGAVQFNPGFVGWSLVEG